MNRTHNFIRFAHELAYGRRMPVNNNPETVHCHVCGKSALKSITPSFVVEGAGRLYYHPRCLRYSYFKGVVESLKARRNPYPPSGYQWRPLGKDEKRVTHSGMPIAPAYTDVFINLDPESKLEAVAKDSKGRTITTPFYKKSFRKGQDTEKFKRIERWEPVYPQIIRHVMKHLPKSEEAKVLYLVDKSRFRVGGEGDTGAEKKAYGASTLLSEHAKVDKDLVKFTFIGKKGVQQVKIIEDPILAEMIRKKKSQERLFDTTEAKVLSFMRKATPKASKFKVSDFRPYYATKKARELIASMSAPKTKAEFKRARKHIGEIVAEDLGNTAGVTLSSYIDPRVWRDWERQLPVVVKKAKKKKRSKR